MQIYQDENALPQKRVAAYLSIMREPGSALSPVIEYFNNQMQDPEVRSFVASHLANLWTYGEMYVDSSSIFNLKCIFNNMGQTAFFFAEEQLHVSCEVTLRSFSELQ